MKLKFTNDWQFIRQNGGSIALISIGYFGVSVPAVPRHFYVMVLGFGFNLTFGE